MDKLDTEIVALLSKNARMTVKEIAKKVSLTSPAVSERIKKLEQSGIIQGYTAIIRRPGDESNIQALISISVAPSDKKDFLAMVMDCAQAQRCFHVTGSYSYLVRVRCSDMQALEHLINKLQKLGQTSTQIILSNPLVRQEI